MNKKTQTYFHPITKLPKYRASDEEPMPTKGNQEVLEAVIEDFRDKAIAGTEKYGTLLETFNGRDAANDLYQELIDLVMYFKQLQMEWFEIRGLLQEYFELQVRLRNDEFVSLEWERKRLLENRMKQLVGYKEDVS